MPRSVVFANVCSLKLPGDVSLTITALVPSLPVTSARGVLKPELCRTRPVQLRLGAATTTLVSRTQPVVSVLFQYCPPLPTSQRSGDELLLEALRTFGCRLSPADSRLSPATAAGRQYQPLSFVSQTRPESSTAVP